MENNTSPPEKNNFKKPVSIFEASALQNPDKKDESADKSKKTDKITTKEKSRGDFLFPIGMLF